MATLSFRENTLLAYQHKEPEFFPMTADMDLCSPGGPDFIRESIRVNGTANDWFGQSWTFEPNIGGANPTPGMHLVPDITKWRDYMKFPDISKLDWEGYSAKHTANWDRENKLSRIIIGNGLWERLFCVMEFTEALMALVAEPEACYDFFGAVADHKIRLHDYIIKYYKPDILVMHDDYGSGGGLFMSVETWRQLIKPHLLRVIDAVTSKGVMYEHHCCGYFAPLVGEIADMGATATNTMHISNKPLKLKKAVGNKMCFVGGFDSQYMDKPDTTEEQIRASIRKTIDDLAPGGSFVGMCGLKILERNTIVKDEMIKYGSTKYTSKRPDFGKKQTDGVSGNPFLEAARANKT